MENYISARTESLRRLLPQKKGGGREREDIRQKRRAKIVKFRGSRLHLWLLGVIEPDLYAIETQRKRRKTDGGRRLGKQGGVLKTSRRSVSKKIYLFLTIELGIIAGP